MSSKQVTKSISRSNATGATRRQVAPVSKATVTATRRMEPQLPLRSAMPVTKHDAARRQAASKDNTTVRQAPTKPTAEATRISRAQRTLQEGAEKSRAIAKSAQAQEAEKKLSELRQRLAKKTESAHRGEQGRVRELRVRDEPQVRSRKERARAEQAAELQHQERLRQYEQSREKLARRNEAVKARRAEYEGREAQEKALAEQEEARRRALAEQEGARREEEKAKREEARLARKARDKAMAEQVLRENAESRAELDAMAAEAKRRNAEIAAQEAAEASAATRQRKGKSFVPEGWQRGVPEKEQVVPPLFIPRYRPRTKA